MKTKVDAECCVFQEKWTHDFFLSLNERQAAVPRLWRGAGAITVHKRDELRGRMPSQLKVNALPQSLSP